MQTSRTPDAAATRGDGLFRVALVAGAVFLLWQAGRGLKGAAWSAFGLAWAAHRAGMWPG